MSPNMMKQYIYDGSFDGLLTCIHAAYYKKDKIADIIPADNMQVNFLTQSIHIPTDTEKAKRVYDAIQTKISKRALNKVFFAYLSEQPGHGISILHYLQLGFKLGPQVDAHLSNDSVLKITRIYDQVAKERHRMTGLIRFKELESGIFYAPIEPDANIAPLLAPHFVSRMRNENWAIHDLKRGIGVLYNKKQWIIKDIHLSDPLVLKEAEEAYQDLWRTYFKAIAIENKINPTLQKKNMPMRYWKHLIEMPNHD